MVSRVLDRQACWHVLDQHSPAQQFRPSVWAVRDWAFSRRTLSEWAVSRRALSDWALSRPGPTRVHGRGP